MYYTIGCCGSDRKKATIKIAIPVTIHACRVRYATMSPGTITREEDDKNPTAIPCTINSTNIVYINSTNVVLINSTNIAYKLD